MGFPTSMKNNFHRPFRGWLTEKSIWLIWNKLIGRWSSIGHAALHIIVDIYVRHAL